MRSNVCVSPEYRLFVKENEKKNPTGHQIIKKIITLPLLPADKILEGLNIIKITIEEQYAGDLKILKKWRKFATIYFEKYWMNTVTPIIFSVYNKVDRTNNYLVVL